MIHPTAIVDPSATLADNVEVGPYTIIGPDVEIGEGTVIGPHVIVRGPTKMGKNNRVFQFSSIGEECQDKKYQGEPTQLIIGDNNVFREACTIHRGTVQDEGVTRIGSNNLFMVNAHIAHDCVVGSNCIIANDSNVAGHVKIGDWVILGGNSQIHQFSVIGDHAMCGGCSVVLKDVPAYVMTQGYPATPHGVNTEGLRRRGFSPESISRVRNAYKTLYRKGLTFAEAIAELEQEAAQFDEIRVLVDSLKVSTRGIIR